MYKNLKYLLFCIVLVSCSNKQYNSLSKEQKIYEFSTIWKEVSYNFSNIDSCPIANVDSLYQIYLSKVMNSKNDFEFSKLIQRFMAEFNNGHTNLEDIPNHLYPYLGWYKLKTVYRDGKVFIENFGKQYSNKLSIDDEIVEIEGIPIYEYLKNNIFPYIATTHPEQKLEFAMFNTNSYYLTWRDSKMKLTLKRNGKTIHVTIKVNDFLLPSEKEKKEEINNEWILPTTMPKNIFLSDSLNSYAYIKLNSCDKQNFDFFEIHQNQIKNFKNIILDLSDNGGGSTSYITPIIDFFLDTDTVNLYPIKARVNNSLFKSYGQKMDNTHRDSWDRSQFNQYHYNFYTGNSYEILRKNEFWVNSLSKNQRYNGNIYVIIGKNSASAAEFLITMLSSNKNIFFIGEKTAGAVGLPLRIFLKSGLVVKINTIKAYDFENNDISNGFNPDYLYNLKKNHSEFDSKILFKEIIDFIKIHNE